MIASYYTTVYSDYHRFRERILINILFGVMSGLTMIESIICEPTFQPYRQLSDISGKSLIVLNKISFKYLAVPPLCRYE